MDITPRQKDILFALIEEYAELATPVGSVSLAKIFNVSSATIRAEMAKLEDLGLIAQPHTSAGRVPTDAGYRYYVNELAATTELDDDCDISDGALAAMELEQELGISPYHPEPNRPSDRAIHAMATRLSSQTRADYAIRSSVDMLVELTGNLGFGTIGDQIYLSGMAKLLSQPEFMDIARVQGVARLLDNLEPWLREAAPGEPLNIFIGHENPIGKSSDLSLIISKFRSPYSDKSYIGVLGPTRQNYSRVMAFVHQAGIMLEEALHEN